MKVVGLDLSLTDTGWASCDSGEGYAFLPPFMFEEGVNEIYEVGRLQPRKMAGMERLKRIRDEMLLICTNADLVVIEGYSFGSAKKQQNSRAHATGEMGGVVRLALFEEDLAVAEMSPTSLKKFATGVGNCEKGLVLTQAVRRLDYQGSNHNEADALWLMFAGLVHLGISPVEFPKLQLEALEKVQWP